jgi:hypothetical protein
MIPRPKSERNSASVRLFETSKHVVIDPGAQKEPPGVTSRRFKPRSILVCFDRLRALLHRGVTPVYHEPIRPARGSGSPYALDQAASQKGGRL